MMRKSACFAGVFVVLFQGAGVAQDSVQWFDIRNNTGAAGTIQNVLSPRRPFTNGQEFAPATPAFNGGMRGDGQKLWLEPDHDAAAGGYTEITAPNGYPNFDADGDRKTGDAWLYLDMTDDPTGLGDTYSSEGIDIDITNGNPPANRNSISLIAFTLINDATVGTGGPPWTAVSNGALITGNPPSWMDARAVYTGGAGVVPITPGGPYRIGRLRVVAGPRNCSFGAGHHARSRFSVKLKVDSLLITRTFSAGGTPPELVSFGYNSGVPDLPISGSSAGATSATDDLVIEVRAKGDGSGDGRVDASDMGSYSAAATASGTGTIKQSQMFLFDFSGDLAVNAADLGAFNAARNGNASCP